MSRELDLIQQGRMEEAWQMCCGYLDLKLEQFMDIQERLLLEQLELLQRSSLGRKLLGGARPRTVDEFRQTVPLTTYEDYCPELAEKREDGLPVKPTYWVHTSGRSGEYPCKWVPLSPTFCRELGTVQAGIGMLASCRERGDISGICRPLKIVYTVAPPPYMSGTMANLVKFRSSTYLPPLKEAEGLPFEERIRLGFQMALSQGLDFFFGMSLVLAAVGDRITQPADRANLRSLLAQPRALLRLTRGKLRSRLARRPLLPKDLWKVKGIVCAGLDSSVYRRRIKEYWGRYPLDVYATTEGGIIATQAWDYDTMTFIPNLNFLEFIPEKEHLRSRLDRSYQPPTVLLNEVKPGENYEIVLTNFHGGVLTRYRIGDMVRISSLRNTRLGINLPQMVFERRADDLLDFTVFRLTEKTIWQALEESRIPYEDWVAAKKPGEPVLSLSVELKDGYQATEAEVARAIYQRVIQVDQDSYTTSAVHEDLLHMVNFRVEANLLPRGAFARFLAQRRAEGADLAHLKPPHVNPPETALALLQARPVTKVVTPAEEAPAKPAPTAVP